MDTHASLIFCLVVLLAALFTYSNGFQDGSSVAASAIGCRALSPLQAVALVSVSEFMGAVFGGSAVADTVHSITSWPSRPDLLPVIACALASAIVWNFVTKKLGLPSSSTHALVGGILGSVLVAGGGEKYIVWGTANNFIHPTGMCKVVISLFLSPIVGFVAGYVTFLMIMLVLMRASFRVNVLLKGAQWLTLATLAFGHGANDTQKAMGVIMLALSAVGVSEGSIPLWVRLLSGLAMVSGIVSIAPRIVKRVGTGIYRMRPVHGFVTQLSSASVVFFNSLAGGPVSASQVIASSVMGVGTAERKKGVNWLVAQEMLITWLLTIPGAAMLSAVFYLTAFKNLNQLL
ncbi:MAG TPA: inorganic phosphate transporter [Candidatus Obscuribacterales bacterium]